MYGLRKILQLLVLVAFPLAVVGTIPVKPYTFTPNTTAQSAQVNSDFDTLYGWANGGIDFSNINGTNGIYPSQIFGDTTAHSTFTTSVGNVVKAVGGAVVPLTVTTASGATADITDFQNGGTTKVTISALGTIGAPNVVLSNVTGVPTSTSAYVANDNAATNGIQFNVPASSTNGYTFAVGGVGKASISAAGLGSFVGVNAGGALTGATSGAFTSNVTTTSGAFVAGSGVNPAVFSTSGNNNAYLGVTGTATGGTVTIYANGTSSAGTASFSGNGNFTANGSITAGSGMTVNGALGGATTGAFSGAVTASQFNGSGAGLNAGSVPIAALAADTISGIALGGNLGTLTIGTHLTGGSYNGSGGVTIATDATSANTASTLVARDGSGNFSAGTITANGVQSGGGANPAIFSQSANNNAYVGVIGTATGGSVTLYPNGTSSAGTATFSANGNLSITGQYSGSGAGLSAIPNSATTATSANTASAIVARDASGNFTAGAITGATNVYAGSSPSASVISGDVSAGTATYGRLVLGGSTSAIDLNYNYNQANVATLIPLGTATLSGFSVTSGWIQASSSGSTNAYVGPTYNASGAALASSTHQVLATGQTCTTGAGGICAYTLSFTGAAQFTANTYTCGVFQTAPASSGNFTIQVQTKAAGSDAFTLAGNPTTTYTFDVACWGA